MDVLVVGGTGFLGGAVVDAARTAGHAVSIFTRGQTKRQADPLVETLVGDRFGDLSGLRDRRFDLVVDTCAFTPDAVADLLDALSPATGRYAFVSSISVYAGLSKPNMDETAPTSRATSEQLAMARALPTEQRSSAASYGSAYGALKREAELVALSHLGDRALILRAGLLVGAGDYTDRLYILGPAYRSRRNNPSTRRSGPSRAIDRRARCRRFHCGCRRTGREWHLQPNGPAGFDGSHFRDLSRTDRLQCPVRMAA
jgi:nucleoside-diphosphate-sugar epimerase